MTDTLHDLTQGFLTEVDRRPLRGGLRVLAVFDAARFDIRLFDRLGLACPDRIAHAVPKRQAEFLAGRLMVRQAQAGLGWPLADIAIGADRAPIWPEGQRGSISHARGMCGAWLTPPDLYCGLDIERLAQGKSLEAIRSVVLRPDEQAPDARAATLVFSAKETLFKALYATVGRVFGFHCARLISITPDSVTLDLTETLHPDLPEAMRFAVSYAQFGTHMVTWMAYRAPGFRGET